MTGTIFSTIAPAGASTNWKAERVSYRRGSLMYRSAALGQGRDGLSQISGWDTANICRFDPRDRRMYARRFQRVLGQSVAHHPIDGVAVGGRDVARHLQRSV
jgi:hypothetical protein